MGRVNAILETGGDPLGTLRALVAATKDPGDMSTQDRLELADEASAGATELRIMLRVLEVREPMGGDYVFLSDEPAETPEEREQCVALTENHEIGYLNARHPGPYAAYTGRSFRHAQRISLAEGSRLVAFGAAVNAQPRTRVGTMALPETPARLLMEASDLVIRRARPARRPLRMLRAVVGADGSVSMGGITTTRAEIVAGRRGRRAPTSREDVVRAARAEAARIVASAKVVLVRAQLYEEAADVRATERRLLGADPTPATP